MSFKTNQITTYIYCIISHSDTKHANHINRLAFCKKQNGVDPIKQHFGIRTNVGILAGITSISTIPIEHFLSRLSTVSQSPPFVHPSYFVCGVWALLRFEQQSWVKLWGLLVVLCALWSFELSQVHHSFERLRHPTCALKHPQTADHANSNLILKTS